MRVARRSIEAALLAGGVCLASVALLLAATDSARSSTSAADGPVLPKFQIHPLILAGTPKLVGFKLSNVPREKVDIMAFGRGFKEIEAKGYLHLVEVRRTDHSRTLRLDREHHANGAVTIGTERFARLQVVVGGQGPVQYEGAGVIERSLEAMLRYNGRGDVRSHVSPNGYECWRGGFRHRKVSCATLR